MILHKGETLFRQGESGPLFRLQSGLLKIVRLHRDGRRILVNVIVPGEIIPHHSLISPHPYYGTAIAMDTCEVDVLSASDWYAELEADPRRFREIGLLLQDRLRMMQQRLDQLTEVAPANKLRKLQEWLRLHHPASGLTELLTQEEVGQFIGLSRETVNRLLRTQSASDNAAAGPKNS